MPYMESTMSKALHTQDSRPANVSTRESFVSFAFYLLHGLHLGSVTGCIWAANFVSTDRC